MKLTLTHGGRTVENAWGLVDNVVWSGDKRRAARTLTFALAAGRADPNLPAVDCPEGAVASLWGDDGQGLFQGVVVSTQLADNSPAVSVTAYDAGVYLANNDGTLKVTDEAPEQAVRRLCGEYDIPVGTLAATGVRVRRKFAGVSLWQIVSTLYTLAARQTGAQYLARFEWDALTVARREEGAENLVIRPGSNLLSAATTCSIEAMRNSVGIYDKDGRRLQTVRDEGAVALYGLMERHIVQRDGEDAVAQARQVLSENGLSRTVRVECMGDARLTTGRTVAVRRPGMGLAGVFWIDADRHTWKGGVHTTQLTLELRNLMYEAGSGGGL